MANYITAAGLQQLQKEFDEIVDVKIPEVLSGLSEALAAGDLKENSARDVLLVEQQHLNTEKVRIEGILNDYEIIEEDEGDNKKIRIGSTVKIDYPDQDKVMTIKITGSSEADTLSKIPLISNESPLAQGLIGKTAGQEIEIRVRQSRFKVKVVEIID
jgi:transcription elongation factor GreA